VCLLSFLLSPQFSCLLPGDRANLPPEGSRAVIERLSNLRVLPDGVWKMHSGDLAHGEAVNAGRERVAGD
jgi:hypothetical protein